MSITTHTSTIREYVKNHTKDDIAFFFEHQFVAKDAEIDMLRKALGTAGERINAQDAEIERLKAELAAKNKALDQFVKLTNASYEYRVERLGSGSGCMITMHLSNSYMDFFAEGSPELSAELRKRKQGAE